MAEPIHVDPERDLTPGALPTANRSGDTDQVFKASGGSLMDGVNRRGLLLLVAPASMALVCVLLLAVPGNGGSKPAAPGPVAGLTAVAASVEEPEPTAVPVPVIPVPAAPPVAAEPLARERSQRSERQLSENAGARPRTMSKAATRKLRKASDRARARRRQAATSSSKSSRTVSSKRTSSKRRTR